MDLTLKEEIQKLSSDQICDAVVEIQAWSRSGILRSGDFT